ncbi:hypothetical protein F4W66_25155 (plasmid) [Escherichia coli]|nr:hypothetical protein F4W66_25155 [Escherichia coli]
MIPVVMVSESTRIVDFSVPGEPLVEALDAYWRNTCFSMRVWLKLYRILRGGPSADQLPTGTGLTLVRATACDTSWQRAVRAGRAGVNVKDRSSGTNY